MPSSRSGTALDAVVADEGVQAERIHIDAQGGVEDVVVLDDGVPSGISGRACGPVKGSLPPEQGAHCELVPHPVAAKDVADRHH